MQNDDVDYERDLARLVDRISRTKAGKLAAYGLGENQIADALLLSVDQVAAVKDTPEYKKGYSDAVRERVDRNIDMEEGWDAVEERALRNVLEAIEFNKDPKFALTAAMVANKAKRRTPEGVTKPIDARHTGNVVSITINKTYITGAQKSGGVIDISAERREITVRKQSDVPTPQLVHKLLEETKPESMGEIDMDLTQIEAELKQSLQ